MNGDCLLMDRPVSDAKVGKAGSGSFRGNVKWSMGCSGSQVLRREEQVMFDTQPGSSGQLIGQQKHG